MILSLLWLHNCILQSQYLLKFLIQLALLISTMAGITLADRFKRICLGSYPQGCCELSIGNMLG